MRVSSCGLLWRSSAATDRASRRLVTRNADLGDICRARPCGGASRRARDTRPWSDESKCSQTAPQRGTGSASAPARATKSMVTTGAGLAVPFAYLAWLHRVPVIWVERLGRDPDSFALRSDGRTYSQPAVRSMARVGCANPSCRVRRHCLVILLVASTVPHPFPRAIRLATNDVTGDLELHVQRGHTTAEPHVAARWQQWYSPIELANAMRAASIVWLRAWIGMQSPGIARPRFCSWPSRGSRATGNTSTTISFNFVPSSRTQESSSAGMTVTTRSQSASGSQVCQVDVYQSDLIFGPRGRLHGCCGLGPRRSDARLDT